MLCSAVLRCSVCYGKGSLCVRPVVQTIQNVYGGLNVVN